MTVDGNIIISICCLLGLAVAVVGIVVSVVFVVLVGIVGVGSALMMVVLAIVVVVLVVVFVAVVGPRVGEAVDTEFRSSLMFRSVNRKNPNMPRPRSVKRARTTEHGLNQHLLCFMGDTCPSLAVLTG